VFDLIAAVVRVDRQIPERVVLLVEHGAAAPSTCDVLIAADFVKSRAKLTGLKMLVVINAKRTGGINVGLHDDRSEDIVELVLYMPHALPL
jgi:hypothetical protein